ncbi:MAG: hypothetical protein AB1489_42025, partial [Acidobacteriota bacterium]
MNLKAIKETVFRVDYIDSEKLISKVYAKSCEIVPSQEWANHSQHKFVVNKAELDRYDIKELIAWMQG